MDEQKLLKRRSKAHKEQDESLFVSTCTALANLYMEQGKFEAAIQEFTAVADIHKKHNKSLDYALVHRAIGEAYLGLSKFMKALDHQKIYLEIAKELNNKLEEQRAYATIGHIYLTHYLDAGAEQDKKNLNQAEKYLLRSLAICQKYLDKEASKLEVADMTARLFSNLGLIQDCLGNFDKARELINRSINLCKSFDIYEQLQRGYMSLASLSEKTGDNKIALQQYNLAVESAEKVSKAALVTALMAKSEVLIKLGDFEGAKSALLKAYKSKTPNIKERNLIEKNLRVVAAMCYSEDEILMTKDNDYVKLKSLYEKMGDGACELKSYGKAIDYYKKMLNAAENGNLPPSDLATCYYSLAETYQDNGQSDEAVKYFEMELNLCKNSLKDSLNTLSKIADLKESVNAPLADVKQIYNRAIEACQKFENKHEEGRMLKRLINYLRRQKNYSEAARFDKIFNKLNYQSSDSDGESSESQTATTVIGNNINLDDITDSSGGSDGESLKRTNRRRNKRFVLKRNMKGETQLHQACISGKFNVVRHLIEQGHPLGVRDHCGWLPLHEACINGHLEIVKLLIEKGSNINDRGGTHCSGITPLHDAASNGHLKIIEFLLDKGANALALTDEGETVLGLFRRWRTTEQLDHESEKLYQSLVDRISLAMTKAGHDNKIDVDLSTVETIEVQDNVNADEEESNQLSDYQNVPEGVFRRRSLPEEISIERTRKCSALIPTEEMLIDDWLDDDVGKTSKKRKASSPLKIQRRRRSRSSSQSNNAITTHYNNIEDLLDIDNYEDLPGPSGYSPNNGTVRRFSRDSDTDKSTSNEEIRRGSFTKRKKQLRLTSFGHTRTVVEADSTSSTTSELLPLNNSKPLEQLSINCDSTLAVDVRIEEKLYRIPVLMSQINTHTIKWLADEAAARYARKEYTKPALELETKNGAVLADDDLVSLLFPGGTKEAEEVTARIVNWNIPLMIDRFVEVCQDLGIDPDEDLSKELRNFSATLDLSNRGFSHKALIPLCKALNMQSNLLELDLSGNYLNSKSFQLLSVSISSLHNLYKINLSCTNMSSKCLQVLAEGLCAKPLKITYLDFSDNSIGNEGLQSLAVITQHFKLKTFNLSYNKFTGNILQCNKNVVLSLDCLENFNISDNELDNEALEKFISWLTPAIITRLNISRNAISQEFFQRLLKQWSAPEARPIHLQEFKLSRTQIQDSDLFDLLELLSSLEVLDLSYNNELTSISLRRLLEIESLVDLNLYGCRNIWKYFPDLKKYLPFDERKKRKSLKISMDSAKNHKEVDLLINTWREHYGDGMTLVKSSRFLALSSG